MDTRAKVLYHQIHPAKLLTDWVTAALAGVLFWKHHLAAGLAIGVIPSVLISWALIRRGDREPHRASRFGRYVARYMNRAMEGLRFVGIAIVWTAAWRHVASGILLGAVVIIGAWC